MYILVEKGRCVSSVFALGEKAEWCIIKSGVWLMECHDELNDSIGMPFLAIQRNVKCIYCLYIYLVFYIYDGTVFYSAGNQWLWEGYFSLRLQFDGKVMFFFLKSVWKLNIYISNAPDYI